MRNLTIEITDKCSLNCIHCSTNSIAKNKFISLHRLTNILDKFQDFEIVRLSGGEPFEHPELAGILKEIKTKGKQTVILSSGVCNEHELPIELLKQIKEYTNLIVFSVYGMNETHNKVCNSQKAFDALNNSVENAKKLRISFSFQTVAMKHTLDDIKNLVRFVKEAKKDIGYCNPKLNVLRFIKQGRGKENQKQALSKEEIIRFIENLENLSKEYGLEITFGCSLKEEGCIAGIGKAAVTINGEEINCSALKYGTKPGFFACKENW